MIKNSFKLAQFYRKLLGREKCSHREALRIYEALHNEAVGLNVINAETILEGIEVDVRVAKVLNSLGKIHD